MTKNKNLIDLESTESSHKGALGLFEATLRKFKVAGQVLIMLPLYLCTCVIFGIALTPGVTLFKACQSWTEGQSGFVQNLALGVCLAIGYFLYGLTLIFASAAANKIFRTHLSEWRGPYYSVESLKWFVHNGLTYLVRFTFLEFVTPSPLNLLFYQMMGMKIGRGSIINSTWISDPSMIELGKKVTIGGSVTMVAHYGQGGLLVIAPIKIGDNCTIGLKSSIMGGAVIGEGVKILPHSVVMPKTQIPKGEVWGGVPAQKIDLKKREEDSRSSLKVA